MRIFRTHRALVPSTAQGYLNRVPASSISSIFPTGVDMIKDVFSRELPIPPGFESRFGPAGFGQNGLYTSESSVTSVYESAYHLIKKFAAPVTFNCATYELDLCAEPKAIVDVSQLPNATAILDPKTYKDSHAWVKTVAALDTVKYPNVRHAGSAGINYAIFNELSVIATTTAPTIFQMTVIGRTSAKIGSTVISPTM